MNGFNFNITMAKFGSYWSATFAKGYKQQKRHSNIDVCETLMPPFPNRTFDLDLWPTDLKINRDHLLIGNYLPTKFESSGANPSRVISCTRLRETDIPTTDGPTDRHVQRNMPLLFQRGHNYHRFSGTCPLSSGNNKIFGHVPFIKWK